MSRVSEWEIERVSMLRVSEWESERVREWENEREWESVREWSGSQLLSDVQTFFRLAQILLESIIENSTLFGKLLCYTYDHKCNSANSNRLSCAPAVPSQWLTTPVLRCLMSTLKCLNMTNKYLKYELWFPTFNRGPRGPTLTSSMFDTRHICVDLKCFKGNSFLSKGLWGRCILVLKQD